MIDRRLRNRYSRQTMFPGIGEEEHQDIPERRFNLHMHVLRTKYYEASEDFMSENQHGIAKAIEAVAQSYCFFIGPINKIFTGKGSNQHQQC